ncbi:MAG: GNAT family N-acetyltransferase [Chitinophagaceae bacterium]
MDIRCKYFTELSLAELYHIWDIRDEVFWVEQRCDEKETDFKDLECHHLMFWDQDILVAYARLLRPGFSYPEASIGRIACRRTYRGNGVGKQLVRTAIDEAQKLFGRVAIKISAQYYLKDFTRPSASYRSAVSIWRLALNISRC